jgi:anion-transporting  ArsA/GET3 family ATPase
MNNRELIIAIVKTKFTPEQIRQLAMEAIFNTYKARLKRSFKINLEDGSDSLYTDLADYIRCYVDSEVSYEYQVEKIVDAEEWGYINIMREDFYE